MEYFSFGEGDPQNTMERLKIKMMGDFKELNSSWISLRIPELGNRCRASIRLTQTLRQHNMAFGLELYP